MSLFKRKKGYEQAFLYIALFVGALFSVVFFIANADTTPATDEDYAPLYEQVEAIQNDFTCLGDYDNIQFYNKSNGKLVLDGGKECALVVYLDSNHNITSTQRIDKSLTAFQYFSSLLLALLKGVGIAFLIVSIIFIIHIVIEKGKRKMKK